MAENDVVTNDQMMNDFFSFDDIELPDNLSSGTAAVFTA